MTQGLGLFLLPLSLKDGGLGSYTTSGLLFLAKAYAGADLENMDQRHHPIERGFVLNATRRATECPLYEKSQPGLYPPWYANKRAGTVPALVGKEFPDVRQNERRIKFIRPKTTKKLENDMKQWLSISAMRQWRRVVAKTWEMNKLNLLLTQLTAWREIPGCRAVTLSWEEGTWGPGRSNITRFHRAESQMEETGHGESSRNLERDPLSISMTIDHHMPEKKIPRVEERIHLKNWRNPNTMHPGLIVRPPIFSTVEMLLYSSQPSSTLQATFCPCLYPNSATVTIIYLDS